MSVWFTIHESRGYDGGFGDYVPGGDGDPVMIDGHPLAVSDERLAHAIADAATVNEGNRFYRHGDHDAYDGQFPVEYTVVRHETPPVLMDDAGQSALIRAIYEQSGDMPGVEPEKCNDTLCTTCYSWECCVCDCGHRCGCVTNRHDGYFNHSFIACECDCVECLCFPNRLRFNYVQHFKGDNYYEGAHFVDKLLRAAESDGSYEPVLKGEPMANVDARFSRLSTEESIAFLQSLNR